MAQPNSTEQTRRLRRFFSSDPIQEVGQEILLSSQETRHLKDVLRVQEGQKCVLIDRQGIVASACIDAFLSSGQTRLRVEEIDKSSREQKAFCLFFYVGIPQKGKMDFLVEKMQEIGVDGVFPLETKRTVMKMAQAGQKRALQRWDKIAQEAAKQSGSLDLIQLGAPKSLEKSLESLPEHAKIIIFHGDSEAKGFRSWLGELEAESKKEPGFSLHLFIGPEGGFSEEEVQQLKQRGAQQVALGQTTLKVETAAIAVAAALKLFDS